MNASEDKFLALYKNDRTYQKWFKRWWAADFSHLGRNRRHANVGYAAGGEFGGRTWTRGWAPPHDLDGRPNPAFSWLTESSTRQHWWQYVRADLAGAFIKGISPTGLSTSSAGLEFCYFEDDLVFDPPAQTSDLSDIFARGAVSVRPQRILDVRILRAEIAGELTITSSRSVQYDISGSSVGGSIRIEGSAVDGTANSTKVVEDVDVQGGLSASSLKTRNLSLTQASNQSVGKAAVLPRLKASLVKISGPYDRVEIDRGRVKSLEVAARGGTALTGVALAAGSVTIHGEINLIDFSEAKISRALELRALNAKRITCRELIAKTVVGSNVSCPVLEFPGARIGGDLSFDRSRFLESLAAPSSIFEGAVSFARCALPGSVDFSAAHFQKGAVFKVGSGSEVAAEPAFKQIGEANFAGSRFEPGQDEVCANFDGRQTLEAANFESTRFCGVPMFYECEFHENISFRGAIFEIEPPKQPYLSAVANLDWKSFLGEAVKAYSFPFTVNGIRLAKAWYALRKPLAVRRAEENHRLSRYERAYNALRQRFSEVGNTKYERQFHNYELRARRRRIDADAPIVEGAVSWVYDAFSKYGQSIARPLAILFFTWVGFACLYFFLAGVNTLDGAVESGVFSARQIVKPFTAWSRDFALSAAPALSGSAASLDPWIRELMNVGAESEVLRSTVVRLFATVQSFLSIVLLFLSGLAVRRTFGVG